MGEWRDLGRSSEYERAFGFDVARGDAREVVERIIAQAEAEASEPVVRREYFSSREARERALRGEPPLPEDPRELHFGVFNVYVNVGTLKSMWVDASIALGVTLLMAGNPVPVALTLIARAIASLQILDEDEAELVHVILGLSEGHAYRQSVAEDTIRAAYVDAGVSIDDLLDRLTERKVIVSRRDGIRLVF